MRKSDILHMCIQNLRRRRSRTLLTVLGVLIGCCSIVIMVSLGLGMKESQENMLAELGDLTIIEVSPRQGGRGKIKLDDAAVKAFKAVSGVEAVTPKASLEDYSLKLYAGNGNRYVCQWVMVAGLDEKAMSAMGYTLLGGEGIKRSGEVLAGQYLAYNFSDSLRPEGSNMVDRWSGDFDDMGRPLNIPDPYFDASTAAMTLEVDTGTVKLTFPLKAVGATKGDYAKGYETVEGLIMPIADVKSIIEKAQGSAKPMSYSSVLVKAVDIGHVAAVQKEIDAQGYISDSMESIRKPMEKEARQKQLMLGGLGAISLFVAALGITNTMIMSISERTREIGVMKALGCYVGDIRAMFLTESAIIGLIGGLVGCFLSFLISITVNMVSMGGFSPAMLPAAIMGGEGISRLSVIPWWLALFAVAFSVFIGLGSGYYPANKAVKISALEAIRELG